ncbi:hypothetical protein [Pseudomonas indica]|uniref:hypothetical protein n=1 Tax=Pseudomonas indica TaxID=137658 RepID=UPI000BABE5F9|nr:hypothetical protein [Pseudomonas indica]PAU51816.1 hypothetical protein BZL42_25050 [Pseudomonas indica]
MNDPLALWLNEWGEWLDKLLTTGLANPTRETRVRIERWCADAEALGFRDQQAAARTMLADDTPATQRAKAFLGLLLEQDMLTRLLEAGHLVEER